MIHEHGDNRRFITRRVRSEDGGHRADGTPRGRRIVVPLGGCETALTVAEARRLRDELICALDTPEAGASGVAPEAPGSRTGQETRGFEAAGEASERTDAGPEPTTAGGPPALADREAMVWAVAYERAAADGHPVRECARFAARVRRGGGR